MYLNVKILIYYWYLKYFKIKSGIFYVDYSFVLHNNYKWVINLQINEQLIFFKLLILSLQLLCCLLRPLFSLLFILFCFIAELTRHSFARIQLITNQQNTLIARRFERHSLTLIEHFIFGDERTVKIISFQHSKIAQSNLCVIFCDDMLSLMYNIRSWHLKAIYYFDINK